MQHVQCTVVHVSQCDRTYTHNAAQHSAVHVSQEAATYATLCNTAHTSLPDGTTHTTQHSAHIAAQHCAAQCSTHVTASRDATHNSLRNIVQCMHHIAIGHNMHIATQHSAVNANPQTSTACVALAVHLVYAHHTLLHALVQCAHHHSALLRHADSVAALPVSVSGSKQYCPTFVHMSLVALALHSSCRSYVHVATGPTLPFACGV